MAMSRKHYVAFAQMLKTMVDEDKASENFMEPLSPSTMKHSRTMRIAHHMSAIFQQDNPHFDRQKFLSACGF